MIAVGEVTDGAVEPDGGFDFSRFPVEAGQSYQIDISLRMLSYPGLE